MFIKIAFLCEGLTASIDRTYKRLFLSMRPQMVEEIVPLLEASIAAIEFTYKYLSPPFAFILEILYILKGAKSRNMKILF